MSGIPAGAGALLGKRLGKYEILALLALGGTAEIYLARIGGAAGFEKYVVVKCLHDHLAGCVDLDGHTVSGLAVVVKELAEHFDDVVVRMIIIVEQHHVPQRGIAHLPFGGQDRGLALARSLSEAQRAKTFIAPETSGEDFATAFRDNLVIRYQGIGYGELSSAQHDLLLNLADYHVGRMRGGHAEVKMAELKRHLRESYFCWMGSMEDDSTFYYRVQNPVIIIEFDHQRGIAFREHAKPYRDHIHVIVRTPNGNDYGKDLLRQHYLHGHQSGR